MPRVTTDETVQHTFDINGGSLTVEVTEDSFTVFISDPMNTIEVGADEIGALKAVLTKAQKLLA